MSQRRKKGTPPTGGSPSTWSTISSHRLLGAVLVTGVLLRLWNIGWGLPYLYEEAIPLRFGMKLWPSLPPSVDFHFFVYPAFGYYLQLFAQYLHFCAGYISGPYESLAGFVSLFETDPSAFTLVARCTTILFDAGIIVMSYLVLDRYHNRTSALVAAVFICFNVLHVRQSHLVNVDTLLAFFSVATLYCLYRMQEEPTTRSYVMSGIAIGFAAASKYNGGILILALIAVHFLATRPIPEGFRPAGLFRLIAGGAAAAVVFLLFNPLIIPHFAEFLEKFRNTETHMEAGHLGLDPGASTIAYYVFESLPANLGLPIAIAAFLASGWLAAKRDRKYYLLLLIPALYLVMLASWKMRADRYIFPAIPFLLMIAAVGITRSLEAITLRIGSRWKTGIAAPASAKAYAAGIVVVLLMIPSFRAVTGYQRTAGLPDTRTAAVEWIGGNAKPGSAIAAGPFGIELSKTKYITLPIQFTAVNSERMTPFYNPEWYKDVDLVVVSDFDYGRYRNEPERFREILGYLDTLRSSWELVRSFEPGDSLTGPAIRLYRYPGEVTDEPFPSQLPGQLLASELETERKVAFLGKLGLILSVQGKLTRSEQLFKILLSLEPDNETAKKALGGLRAFRASPGKTDNRVAGKASREPAAAGALVAEGDSLFAIGNLDDAEKSYRDALGKDRNQVNAYLGLTMIYAARDERNKVVRTLKELLSILPPGSEDYARVQGQLKSIEGDNP